ncbi:MAG: hypothetical protein PHQ42_02025 [Patescibacteria group bacterium]|nr:hypothetical protein [Patescibacteria group bacterium]
MQRRQIKEVDKSDGILFVQTINVDNPLLFKFSSCLVVFSPIETAKKVLGEIIKNVII